MESYCHRSKSFWEARRKELLAQYEAYCQKGLSLDMSRGKPCAQQLDLTLEMLECVNARDGYRAADGTDTRNYGMPDGIPEARRMFADLLDVPPERVIVGGNSSLNMMFDYIGSAYAKGVCGGIPWSRQGNVRFLCPVPGYDRHFSVTEYFGIRMTPVPMTPEGPDMDAVEREIRDPLVKGIWCVPMYSNPEGITYSDETVRRFAALNPAAEDFRVMWDNAYCVHHLTDTPDTLLNIFREAEKTGKEDLFIEFASTSKISFPGSGLAALTASPRNLEDIRKRIAVQTIGPDKLNMLRHVRFFGDANGIRNHMKRHAAILAPRFALVLDTLSQKLGGKGIASWRRPNGGYFISVNLYPGTAKKTAALLRRAGVVITDAGATFPYGHDPADSNLRLAPTFPPMQELALGMELFCLCAELAALEKWIEESEAASRAV